MARKRTIKTAVNNNEKKVEEIQPKITIDEPMSDENFSTSNIKQTVNVVGTVSKSPIEIINIILLKDTAGMRSGTRLQINKTDDAGNVYFMAGQSEMYFDIAEKGKLWNFDSEK